MVGEKILYEVTFVSEGADVEQTKFDTSAVMLVR